MAGKSDDKDGFKQTLWPLFWGIKAVFLSLIVMTLAIVTMAVYLARTLPANEQQAHLDSMMVFYVDNAIARDRANFFGQETYRWLLVETGVERIVLRPARSARSDGRMSGVYSNVANFGLSLWQITSKTIYILGAKLSNLVSALPLLGLLACVAVVDGWVARYIRRSEGGNESATRYHMWKSISHSWLPSAMLLAFLLCPIPVEPLWFLLPTALVFLIGLRSQTKYFKKYL